MKVRPVAAIVFAVISCGAAAFQVALALGAPWGAYAMGGAFAGGFPAELRITAIVQAAVLLLLAGIVLARAGVALHTWSRASLWLIWLVVAFAAVSQVLNLITPSAGERMVWAPIALVLLACSLTVATGSKAVE